MLRIHNKLLNPAIENPLMGSMDFLNEIMARYPNAISFAPGAPNLAVNSLSDPTTDLQVFVEYLRSVHGIDDRKAKRMLLEYGPSAGIINDVIARALERYLMLRVAPEHLVITVGAQEAMFLLLLALKHNSQDILAVATPSYFGISGAAKLLQMEVIGIPESDGGIDVSQLRAECDRARTREQAIRAVYVAPDHANPSGSTLDISGRNELLETAEECGFLIIEDSVYSFTSNEGESFPSLKALDVFGCVVQVGSFAKILAPGYRIGYVLADQLVEGSPVHISLATVLASIKSMVTLNTSPLTQAMVAGALLQQDLSFERLSKTPRDYYHNNINTLLMCIDRYLGDIPGVSWNQPTGGFFVRVRVPVGVDFAALQISAEEYGVLWTPMAPFYVNGGGEDELRLSCSYVDLFEIEEGCRRLRNFLVDWCTK